MENFAAGSRTKTSGLKCQYLKGGVGLCASECFYVFKDQGNKLASCRNKMSTPEVFEGAKPEEVNNGSRIQENKHRFFHGTTHSVHSVKG